MQNENTFFRHKSYGTPSPPQPVPPTNVPFFPPLWQVVAPAAAAVAWSCHTSGCRWTLARPAEPPLEHVPLGTAWRTHRGEIRAGYV